MGSTRFVNPLYREAETNGLWAPAGPEGAKAEIQIWRQSTNLQSEANAENTSGPLDGGPPSAAPHHVAAAALHDRHHAVIHRVAALWPATIFSMCLLWYFLLWPHIVLSVLAAYCILRPRVLSPSL